MGQHLALGKARHGGINPHQIIRLGPLGQTLQGFWEGLGVGTRAADLGRNGVGVVQQVNARLVRGIGFRHLYPTVAEGHHPRARSFGKGLGQGKKIRRIKVMIELGRDVASQLQMLLLVIAHGNVARLIDQDVGGLEHRVGVEPDAGPLLILSRFLLELGHAVEPTEARDAVEDPGELRVLGHGRLGENRGPPRVHARGHIGGGDLAGLAGQGPRVLRRRDGVQIHHAIKALHAVLQRDELHQSAKVVAKMQGA